MKERPSGTDGVAVPWSGKSIASSSSGRLQVFASRYKLHLPSEGELRAELERELAQLVS